VDRRSRRQFLQGSLTLAGLGLVSGCGPLLPQAQPPPKTRRLGVLSSTGRVNTPQAISEGLRDLGYTAGRDFVIEARVAEGSLQALPDLAAELVRLPVDVLLTVGTAATSAAADATKTIPIVQATGASDLVQDGLAASLARPGGNVTGLTEITPELTAKRLDILKQALPGLRRVAVLWNPGSQPAAAAFSELPGAARALSVELQSLEVRKPDELAGLGEAAIRGQADALLMLTDPISVFYQEQIAGLAAASRLPSMFDRKSFAAAGGLIGYGPDALDLQRRAATYVDKILKGARPADLPIERPTRFDLVINLKTARALGLTIPQEVLMQVTEAIE
jgi:putative ABC transport system substrate-binding protein